MIVLVLRQFGCYIQSVWNVMSIDSCYICKENATCDLMTACNAAKRQYVCNVMIRVFCNEMTVCNVRTFII